jgi:alcohol dehydrogenase class IV
MILIRRKPVTCVQSFVIMDMAMVSTVTTPPLRTITLYQPNTLAFGAGCAVQVADQLRAAGKQRALIVTSPPTRGLCQPIQSRLSEFNIASGIWDGVDQEPSIATFKSGISAARDAKADAIIGLGGGSAMDVAKLVAALVDSKQDIRDVFGIGKLTGRSTWMACLPTTAGTGSEVSPNAILLDESEQLKKGVISSFLVPDAASVDPMLTLGVPPAVTGATGVDALTHCIEAYANKLSHPMIDLVALEGVRLIAKSLPTAYSNGRDVDARTNVALGSLYGGLCLGPVNTGAVHALSYPLGGEFHVAHGVANAVLLPHVIEFNLPAAPARYAAIGRALGAETKDDHEAARRGVEILKDLSRRCGIPQRLSELKIPESAIPRLAKSGMTVTRLLDRNVRTVTEADAIEIYRKAF